MLYVKIVGVAFALISACFWWISTWKTFQQTTAKELSDVNSSDGDLALKLEDGGNWIVLTPSKIARLNAFGALFAGMAVATQAFIIWFEK